MLRSCILSGAVALRFNIKDLLGITLVVALMFLVLRSRSQVLERQSQIAIQHAHSGMLQRNIDLQMSYLVDETPRSEYYQQIDGVYRSAIGVLGDLQEKHSQLQPKPGWISYRQFPVLRDSKGQTVWEYRIAVPSEYPVFLRSGVSASPAAEFRLDTEPWLAVGPLVDSAPHELMLSPGIHAVRVTFQRGQNDQSRCVVMIQVDGETIFDSKAKAPNLKISSLMNHSPHQQTDLRFDAPAEKYGRRTNFLVSFNMKGTEDPLEYGFWVWFSRTPIEGRFTGYLDQELPGSERAND